MTFGKTECILLSFYCPKFIVRVLGEAVVMDEILLIATEFASCKRQSVSYNLKAKRAKWTVSQERRRILLVS